MIHFACFQCGMKFKVKAEFAGWASKCPTCKTPLRVPEPPSVETVPPTGALEGSASSLHQADVDAGVHPNLLTERQLPSVDIF